MATRYDSSASTEHNRNCYLCLQNFNRTRASLCQCFHCNQNFCLECFALHKENLVQNVYSLQDRYNEINQLMEEKRKYIVDSSAFCMNEVLTWFQKSINDLFNSQQQIINNIEFVQDKAQIKLADFNELLQPLSKEIHFLTQDSAYDITVFDQITKKLDDIYMALKYFTLTKEVNMPSVLTLLPQYKISFITEQLSDTTSHELENRNENTNQKLEITTLSTALSPTTNQSVEHKNASINLTVDSEIYLSTDLVADEIFPIQSSKESNFDIEQNVEVARNHDGEMDDSFVFDYKLYRLVLPRHYDFDIQCLTSNGTDTLCYSKTSKKLIYQDDKTGRQMTLDWYHDHITHLNWFRAIEAYVILTQDRAIYSIELDNNNRLKIRSRHRLMNEIVSSPPVFMQTDAEYIYYCYETESNDHSAKYLRLLNLYFQDVRVYSLDKCLSINKKHVHQNDRGQIVGLAVNNKHIVLLQHHGQQNHEENEDEWDIDENSWSPSSTHHCVKQRSYNNDIHLLIFDKKMKFLQRFTIDGYTGSLPIFYYNSPSGYFMIDQTRSILRFFNKNNETGEVKLIPKQSTTTASVTASGINCLFTSITLMNDGTLLITNNTKDVIQLSVGEINT